MRYTQWEQVDTSVLRPVHDLPLPRTENRRLITYLQLEERIIQERTPRLGAGYGLVEKLIDLYHLQNLSYRHIANELSHYQGQQVYPALVRLMLDDFGIPKKSFPESVTGKKHGFRTALSEAERETIRRMLPDYAPDVLAECRKRDVKPLTEIVIDGTPRTIISRIRRYTSIERSLGEGVCLPLFIDDLYRTKNLSCENIASVVSEDAHDDVKPHLVHLMIHEFGIEKKSASEALRGKTRKPTAYLLPEYDLLTQKEASVYGVKLLDELMQAVKRGPGHTRCRRYETIEKKLGTPLPLYVHTLHWIEDHSANNIAAILTQKTGMNVSRFNVLTMMKEFNITRRKERLEVPHGRHPKRTVASQGEKDDD